MSTPTHIIDGLGTKNRVKVTKLGQLVTGVIEYDETTFLELAEPDTAYNFYTPKAGQQFVITGIFAVADKQVSGNASATVIIYEATGEAETTISKVLLQTAMVQDQIQLFTPLNILVREGRFINAKTDDDDIHMTITGYYIPKL